MRETYHYEGDLTWAMLVDFVTRTLQKYGKTEAVISYFDFAGLDTGTITVEISVTDTKTWLTVE